MVLINRVQKLQFTESRRSSETTSVIAKYVCENIKVT